MTVVRRSAAIVLALLSTLLWLVPATSAPAYASCVVDPQDPSVRTYADVIFTGVLVADQSAKFGREREYTFRVDRVFRGAAFAEQIVASPAGSSISLELQVQQTYLVQAKYPSEGAIGPVARLVSDTCSGTRVINADNQAPTDLGTGQDPAVGTSRSFTSRFNGRIWMVAGVACILGAVVVTARNRRRR